MKVKTVRARRVEEALYQIAAELGPEAVVVAAHRVPAGSAWHVWRAPLVELVAVLPEDRAAAFTSLPPSPEAAGERLGVRVESPADHEAIRWELMEMLARSIAHPPMAEVGDQAQPGGPSPALLRLRRNQALILRAQGLDEKLAHQALWAASADLTGAEPELETLFKRRLTAYLQSLITADCPPLLSPPFPDKGGDRGEVASRASCCFVVGPPGAGKSTALARLAQRLQAGSSAPVELVAVAWAREPEWTPLVDAANQLGMPLTLVRSPQQLREKVEAQLSPQDGATCLLIDTPGCAPGDSAALGELVRFASALPASNRALTQLVLNAASAEDLTAVASAFAPIAPAGVIWTHLDETRLVGPIFNLGYATGLPLTYLSYGTEGWADIVPAADYLSHLVHHLVSPPEATAEDETAFQEAS